VCTSYASLAYIWETANGREKERKKEREKKEKNDKVKKEKHQRTAM
jgi:hypothetical protein